MDSPRVDAVRSPADVLRVGVAVAAWALLLLFEVLFGAGIVDFTAELLGGLSAIDAEVLSFLVGLARLFSIAVLVALAVPAVRRGGWRVGATVVVGAALSLGALAAAEAIIDARAGTLVELADTIVPLTDGGFPTTAGLAMATAALAAMGPWARRSSRRASWAAMLALTAAHFVASPVSGSSFGALLSGWVGGSIAVLAFGAPPLRPGTDAVIAGLRSVGLDIAHLEPASVDARGSTPYFGETANGRRLFVKVLGRDERSADLLFRLYRAIVPRRFGDERPFSSLRRTVEHEALVALSAATHGVRTPPVLALADAEPGGFVLAYEAIAGRSLDEVAPERLDDAVVDELWAQVAILRRHRTAHRDLRLANVFLADDDSVWLIDFGFAELAASQLLLDTDVAELVTSLSLLVGAERAVGAARGSVGAEALTGALDRIDPKYLSGATRTAVRERPGFIDEVRRAVTAATTVVGPGAHQAVEPLASPGEATD